MAAITNRGRISRKSILQKFRAVKVPIAVEKVSNSTSPPEESEV